jgi:hypothetical protein
MRKKCAPNFDVFMCQTFDLFIGVSVFIVPSRTNLLVFMRMPFDHATVTHRKDKVQDDVTDDSHEDNDDEKSEDSINESTDDTSLHGQKLPCKKDSHRV